MDVRRWVAAALCVPLLALAGCSEDKSQADPQEPTTSAAASPSPSETPSPPPQLTFTERNAKQFVAYWIESFNLAVTDGATGDLRALALKTCRACTSIADTIDDVYTNDGRIESEGWKPERFDSAKLTGERTGTVELRLRLSPQEIYRSADADPERTSGGRGTATFELDWSGSTWRVANLTQATS